MLESYTTEQVKWGTRLRRLMFLSAITWLIVLVEVPLPPFDLGSTQS
jgi:hypothetical protein